MAVDRWTSRPTETTSKIQKKQLLRRQANALQQG